VEILTNGIDGQERRPEERRPNRVPLLLFLLLAGQRRGWREIAKRERDVVASVAGRGGTPNCAFFAGRKRQDNETGGRAHQVLLAPERIRKGIPSRCALLIGSDPYFAGAVVVAPVLQALTLNMTFMGWLK